MVHNTTLRLRRIVKADAYRKYPIYLNSWWPPLSVQNSFWNNAVPPCLKLEYSDPKCSVPSICGATQTQILECTCSMSHNAPIRSEIYKFLFWIKHYGILDGCISILPIFSGCFGWQCDRFSVSQWSHTENIWKWIGSTAVILITKNKNIR